MDKTESAAPPRPHPGMRRDVTPPSDRTAATRRDRTTYLRRLLPIIGPALLMAIIGSIGATRPVLSWDEVATADVARRSVAQIWALVHHVDAVIGPYYLLMHAWTSVAGTSEAALRVPSIVAMAAAVGLAGELGRRLFSPLVGVTAGLILCLVPTTSRYAAEARPYAFSCLFSVLALVLLHGALRRPGPGRWAGYGVAVVLLGLSHVVALTTLAAHAVAVAYAWRRGRTPRVAVVWAATVAVALLALVPVFLLGTGQRDTQLFWVDQVTPGTLRAGPAQIVGSPETAWLLIGLALVAAWRRWDAIVELAVLALVPPAAVALISLLTQPLWVPRYLLVVLTPLALLAAVATVSAGNLPQRRARLLRVLLVLVVVAGAAYPGQRAVRSPTAKNGADYRSAARVIERGAQPGDAIMYEDQQRALRAGVEYYDSGARYRPRDVLVRRSPAQAASLVADEYRDVAPHMVGVQRVWLVVTGDLPDPTVHKPRVRPVLRADFQRVGRWHVHGATVTLYQRRR